MNSLILSTATRLLMPLILLLSIFVFFRGHNAPGGGFVGGLLAATAFALLEKAEGLAAARRALRFHPQSIAAVGLGCALASGRLGRAGIRAFPEGGLAVRQRRRRRRQARAADRLDPALRLRRLSRGARHGLRHPLRARGGAWRPKRTGGTEAMEIMLAAPDRPAGRRRRLPDDERQDAALHLRADDDLQRREPADLRGRAADLRHAAAGAGGRQDHRRASRTRCRRR